MYAHLNSKTMLGGDSNIHFIQNRHLTARYNLSDAVYICADPDRRTEISGFIDLIAYEIAADINLGLDRRFPKWPLRAKGSAKDSITD